MGGGTGRVPVVHSSFGAVSPGPPVQHCTSVALQDHTAQPLSPQQAATHESSDVPSGCNSSPRPWVSALTANELALQAAGDGAVESRRMPRAGDVPRLFAAATAEQVHSTATHRASDMMVAVGAHSSATFDLWSQLLLRILELFCLSFVERTRVPRY